MERKVGKEEMTQRKEDEKRGKVRADHEYKRKEGKGN